MKVRTKPVTKYVAKRIKDNMYYKGMGKYTTNINAAFLLPNKRGVFIDEEAIKVQVIIKEVK